MNLDQQLVRIAVKMKNLVVIDLSFPATKFPEFKSNYETRFMHWPGRQHSAIAVAAGLASRGKVVLLYGSECEDCEPPDSTLNVKLVKESERAVWDHLEEELMEFGPSVLLLPKSL